MFDRLCKLLVVLPIGLALCVALSTAYAGGIVPSARAIGAVPPVAAIAGPRQIVPIGKDCRRLVLKGWVLLVPQKQPGSASVTPAARLRLEWLNSAGNAISCAPNTLSWATTPAWTQVNLLLRVPRGAASLVIQPEVDSAAGRLDLRDFATTEWVETFADDFKGRRIDNTRWTVSTGPHITSAPEQQIFSPECVSVGHGEVALRAEKHPAGKFGYRSGEISTKGKFTQRYGVFEATAKTPSTIGSWPAFYLLRYDDAWPPEIDIDVTSGATPNKVNCSEGWLAPNGTNGYSGALVGEPPFMTADWHWYAVVWEPTGDRVRCYRALAAMTDVAVGNESYARLMWWWRRSLPIRTEEDRKEFLPAMADIYAAEALAYPAIKNIH